LFIKKELDGDGRSRPATDAESTSCVGLVGQDLLVVAEVSQHPQP